MNKKIIGLSIIVIIVGLIMIAVKGFNVSLKYREHKVMQISVGQDFDVKDIKAITKEVFGKKQVSVEKAGLYNDELSIGAEDITDEEADLIVKKINEKYNLSQQVLVPVTDEYEISDVESIVKEVLGTDSVKVEKYEESASYASIETGIITEKTAEDLTNKLNEKYGTTNTKDSVQTTKAAIINTVGKVTLKDMAKQYTFYVIIATVAVIAYFAIIYRKLGFSAVITKSIVSIVLSELLFISLIAITRYPLDKLVIMGALAIYIAVITYLNKIFNDEKQKESK